MRPIRNERIFSSRFRREEIAEAINWPRFLLTGCEDSTKKVGVGSREGVLSRFDRLTHRALSPLPDDSFADRIFRRPFVARSGPLRRRLRYAVRFHSHFASLRRDEDDDDACSTRTISVEDESCGRKAPFRVSSDFLFCACVVHLARPSRERND